MQALTRVMVSCFTAGVLIATLGLTMLTMPLARPQHCTEDATCWNWTTMGNHTRGIYLRDGRIAVVTPSGYCDAIRANVLAPVSSGSMLADPGC